MGASHYLYERDVSERLVDFDGAEFAEKTAACDPMKILYVGMTRARERLVLTGSADNPWVERFADLAA